MMLLLLFFVSLLLLGSALASMTEAALFSVSLSRAHLAVEEQRWGARRLLAIKQNLQRPVAALVIVNNTINIAGSIFVGQQAEKVWGSQWIGLFSAILTFLIITFGEIIPKTLGERFAEAVALNTAAAVNVLTRILLPVIYLVERVTLPITRLPPRHIASREEIRLLAKLGSKAGTISSDEGELIRKTFRLNDVTARDIMTHRLKVSFLPAERLLKELKPEEVHSLHSRIVVAEEGDLDKVNGVVYLRDILLAFAKGESHRLVAELKQPVPFVYEGTPAHRLLREFQRTHQHLFVVVDEYGGMSGIVTLEDVIEELVGDIEDETDVLPIEMPRPQAASAAKQPEKASAAPQKQA